TLARYAHPIAHPKAGEFTPPEAGQRQHADDDGVTSGASGLEVVNLLAAEELTLTLDVPGRWRLHRRGDVHRDSAVLHSEGEQSTEDAEVASSRRRRATISNQPANPHRNVRLRDRSDRHLAEL